MSVLGELLHERRARPSFGRLMQLTASAASVALLAGIVWWGWRVAMRDISGVPVVRALEGPARIAPVNPEGDQIEHQGLAVNEVQAEGSAGEIADRLQLAPSVGDLRESDLAPADLAAASAPAPVEGTAALAPGLSQSDGAVLAALADEPLAGDVAATPAPVTAIVLPEGFTGVRSSPLPQPRPAGLTLSAAEPEVVEPAAVLQAEQVLAAASEILAVEEISLEQLENGAQLVQLGAFDSEEQARSAWDQMASEYSDVLKGKKRVIEMTTAGGAPLYRLRAAGFEGNADANKFCAAIGNGMPTCITVTK